MPTTDGTYQPAQVAALLGVNVGTIRRWTTAHSAHLSHSAAPVPGGRRKLTPRDLEVLRVVRDLRDEGLSTLQVNDKLDGLTIAEPINTEPPQIAPAPHSEEITPIVAPIDLASLTAPFVARLEAIERRQAADSAERRHWLTAFALGMICMGLLIVLIALLVIYAK